MNKRESSINSMSKRTMEFLEHLTWGHHVLKVRVQTVLKWPNGHIEESFVDKPVVIDHRTWVELRDVSVTVPALLGINNFRNQGSTPTAPQLRP
eukprot:1290752-Amphidinium_carterae.1